MDFLTKNTNMKYTNKLNEIIYEEKYIKGEVNIEDQTTLKITLLLLKVEDAYCKSDKLEQIKYLYDYLYDNQWYLNNNLIIKRIAKEKLIFLNKQVPEWDYLHHMYKKMFNSTFD